MMSIGAPLFAVPMASGTASRTSRHADSHGERGAALIEFALIVPFVLLLVFGIVEFSWAFSQQIDVRHGAREAGRLVAVGFGDSASIANRACEGMDLSGGQSITFSGAGGAVGDRATVRVTAPLRTLTGFLDWALPGEVSSQIQIRLEQDGDGWSNGTFRC